MFFENELEFLCKILQKNKIKVSIFDYKESASMEKRLQDTLNLFSDISSAIVSLMGKIEEKTMYRLVDRFDMQYIYFLLNNNENIDLVFIGPFAAAVPTEKHIMEIAEKSGSKIKRVAELEEICSSVPVVEDDNMLFSVLDAFCERVWSVSSAKKLILSEDALDQLVSPNASEDASPEETLEYMKLMEQRYKQENALIEAVTNGQTEKAEKYAFVFSMGNLEKRTADPVRNLKNYCVIMNTLLRKAAENGGVHPIYIDRTSSLFAHRIENIKSVAEIEEVMKSMFLAYCRLVRKHSMKGYSSLVKKTIVYIESDISANLSLELLASVNKVSAGYLSTVFKKETGKNLVEYITDKRISYAKKLLKTTELQIQTVALNCGIMDVQYFSKLFKKKTGHTPKEYRIINRQI